MMMKIAAKLLPWLLAWPAALVLAGACAPDAAPEAGTDSPPQAGAGEEMFGETPESILKISFADWENIVHENKGDVELADAEKALGFWIEAVAAHNTQEAEALGDPKGSSILLAASLLESAAAALSDANLAAAPDKVRSSADAMISGAQIQALVHELLKEDSSLPEGMLSGNLFAEIEDAWVSETSQAAEENETQEKVAPAVEAALAAVRAARTGEYEGLSEAEVHAIRQLLAHWLTPESFDAPVLYEGLGPFID